MPSTCGAGVLNSRWLITATHCIQWNKQQSVVLGQELFDDYFFAHKHLEITIDKMIRNSIKYETDDWADFTLLKTHIEIPIQKYTPLCLPPPNFNVRGKKVTVAGWGLTGSPENQITPETLREILKLEVVSESVCGGKYFQLSFFVSPDKNLSESMIQIFKD